MLTTVPFRLFWHYYWRISRINLLFSVAAYVLTLLEEMIFVGSFLTVGFVVALLWFYFNHEQEYYFYYNRGLSKLKLMLLSGICNGVLVVLLIGLLKVVQAW